LRGSKKKVEPKKNAEKIDVTKGGTSKKKKKGKTKGEKICRSQECTKRKLFGTNEAPQGGVRFHKKKRLDAWKKARGGGEEGCWSLREARKGKMIRRENNNNEGKMKRRIIFFPRRESTGGERTKKVRMWRERLEVSKKRVQK